MTNPDHDQSTDPALDAIERGPLPAGPPWRLVVGAVFGGLVLLGFFYIAVRAADGGPQIVCNAFYPLTAFFALGTAMAGAFIGGEIGAKGTLPIGQFGYAAVGGIAGLVTVFLISFFTYDSFCRGGAQVGLQLEIQDIPKSLVATELPADFWVQKRRNDILVIRFDETPLGRRDSTLLLRFEKSRECRIDVVEYQHNEIASKEEELKETSFLEKWKASPKIIVKFNPEYVGDAEAARYAVSNCLRSSTHPGSPSQSVENKIESDGVMLSLTRLKQLAPLVEPLVGQPSEFPIPPPLETEKLGSLSSPGTESFALVHGFWIGSAYAAEEDYQSLLNDLIGSDERNAAEAKKGLSEDGTHYSTELRKSLRDTHLTDRARAAVLDILVELINSEQRELTPGYRMRDLSQLIRLFDDSDYRLLISFLNSPDPTLRYQARRLTQRFPVDRFALGFQQIEGGQLFSQSCDAESVERLKYFRYGALQFYYNRVADKFYAKKTSRADDLEIDTAYADGVAATRCLPASLRVDVALLDYARALIAINGDFNRAKGVGPVGPTALAAARGFMKRLSSSEANYVYPAHILYMSLFRPGISWQSLTKEAAQVQGATVGSAAGLMSGEAFRQTAGLTSTGSLELFYSPRDHAAFGKADVRYIQGILAETGEYSFVKFKDEYTEWRYGWVQFSTAATPDLASWAESPPDVAFCFQRDHQVGEGRFLVRCFKNLNLCLQQQQREQGQRTGCRLSAGLGSSPSWKSAGRGGILDSWFLYSASALTRPFPEFSKTAGLDRLSSRCRFPAKCT
ncbi:hypothetical protein NKH17_31550 [Mesorhizobium sp. M1334]|uniref:hypothetical protein n=1 Tax=Mesorhizobium sp. M1334 TaxID=2957084 RepID=UPI0033371CDB